MAQPIQTVIDNPVMVKDIRAIVRIASHLGQTAEGITSAVNFVQWCNQDNSPNECRATVDFIRHGR